MVEDIVSFFGTNFVRPITFNVSTFLFLFYFYNDKFLACKCCGLWLLSTPMINALNSMINKSFGFIIFYSHVLIIYVQCIVTAFYKQFPYLLRSCDVGDFKKCNEASNSIHLRSIIQIIKPFLLLLDAICNIASMILIGWYFSCIRSK